MNLNRQDNALCIPREKRSVVRTIREALEVIKMLSKNVDFWEGAEGGTPALYLSKVRIPNDRSRVVLRIGEEASNAH
jgi:hypothetical protein